MIAHIAPSYLSPCMHQSFFNKLCFFMSHGEIADICCVCFFYTFLYSIPFPLFSVAALSLFFHTQPASVVQKQGSAVHLQCLVHPASATVTWLFQGRALEPGSLPGVEVQPGRISLHALQPHNTGIYQCVAHSDTDSITSQWARVTIAGMHMGTSHSDVFSGVQKVLKYT